MNKIEITLPAIKLVGITARTNNASELNPLTAKIVPTLQQYFQKSMAADILNRKKPGTTYCVYTDYASDYNGDYTYFVGEEVNDFEQVPNFLTCLTIPSQKYAKFTNGPGIMPAVCIDVWQKIWKTPEILEGDRRYTADFEVYDQRAINPAHATLDIYVGIA